MQKSSVKFKKNISLFFSLFFFHDGEPRGTVLLAEKYSLSMIFKALNIGMFYVFPESKRVAK